MQEARALRSKVHLSEQAQRAAQSMERDYEEVVRLLEAELLEVKARDSKIMVGYTLFPFLLFMYFIQYRKTLVCNAHWSSDLMLCPLAL